MQVDPHTEWTWKPAQQGCRRAGVMVGALLIMAASCVTAGFVVGRLTAGTAGGNATPHVVRVGEIPTAALAATPSVPFKKQPERDMALASGGVTPSVVILNPGTADVGMREDLYSPPNPRVPDASQLRSGVRTPDPRDKRLPAIPLGGAGDRREAGTSTERDYHALRDYMLTR